MNLKINYQSSYKPRKYFCKLSQVYKYTCLEKEFEIKSGRENNDLSRIYPQKELCEVNYRNKFNIN